MSWVSLLWVSPQIKILKQSLGLVEHPRLFGGSLGKLMSDIAANSMFWPLDVLIDVQLVLAGLFFFIWSWKSLNVHWYQCNGDVEINLPLSGFEPWFCLFKAMWYRTSPFSLEYHFTIRDIRIVMPPWQTYNENYKWDRVWPQCKLSYKTEVLLLNLLHP